MAPAPIDRGVVGPTGEAGTHLEGGERGGGGPGGVHLDVLVLGSGVAGLSAAIRAGSMGGMAVGVLSKAELSQSATRWAQGGVAAVLGEDEDSTDLHLADTLSAGVGLCEREAVRILVDEGPARVHELIALGAVFDRRPEGDLALAREGGHSVARVVHAGGAATGAEIERALVEAVRGSAAAVMEGWFATDLVLDQGRCVGVEALDPQGNLQVVRADHVILATGGAGQVFAVTTNPSQSTGDGLAMALRAGVACADVEFMQFHPTALHHAAMPRPLLSEALRGHGAKLRDFGGDRFVEELSPRDVVSRAMTARMADEGVDHLWLDATELVDFDARFPTIAASLAQVGLDPSRDWLPIAPAAHYLSGGVVTDLSGATELAGLWACGEVACTGVHGANRLASNSLLEGMVFAPRVIEAIESGQDGPRPTGAMRSVIQALGIEALAPLVGADGRTAGQTVAGQAGAVPHIAQIAPGPGPGPGPDIGGRGVQSTVSGLGGPVSGGPGLAGAEGGDAAEGRDVAEGRDRLERAMTRYAGVLRSQSSLAQAQGAVDEATAQARLAYESCALGSGQGAGGVSGASRARAVVELINLVTVAQALVDSALVRTESRGAHTRTDFPETRPDLCLRLVHTGRGRPDRHRGTPQRRQPGSHQANGPGPQAPLSASSIQNEARV
ncbi:MAG: L-aspartate oxidase [Acidimicrobiales bacterium]